MRKVSAWIGALLILGSLEYVDYLNFKAVFVARQENRILSTNVVQLLKVNEYLSTKMGEMAESMLQRAEWDKKVAENIRKLNETVYGKTNQTVSPTVP